MRAAARAAALAGALLAACCPVPAGPSAADALGLPLAAPAPGSPARLTVRTSAGTATDGGRLARTAQDDVVRLVPEAGVALPADATLLVTGRWNEGGTLRVSSATIAPAPAAAR